MRTTIVTGASSGIGEAVTDLLRARGQRVVSVSRTGEVPGDLRTPDGRRVAAAAALEAAGGRVDAVIACAATGQDPASLVSVGYFGAVEFLEILRPALLASDSPRAATVTSVSVFQPAEVPLVDALRANDEGAARELARKMAGDPLRQHLVESSVKRALARWVRAASVTEQWAGQGIALNAVAPGVTLSPKIQRMLQDPAAAAYADRMVPMPFGGAASPQAVAELLVWLTSEANTACTGQNIFCDGGSDAVVRGEDIWQWADPAMAAHFGEIRRTAP